MPRWTSDSGMEQLINEAAEHGVGNASADFVFNRGNRRLKTRRLVVWRLWQQRRCAEHNFG